MSGLNVVTPLHLFLYLCFMFIMGLLMDRLPYLCCCTVPCCFSEHSVVRNAVVSEYCLCVQKMIGHGTQCSGCQGGVCSKVGLYDLRGLFQPKGFYSSVMQLHVWGLCEFSLVWIFTDEPDFLLCLGDPNVWQIKLSPRAPCLSRDLKTSPISHQFALYEVHLSVWSWYGTWRLFQDKIATFFL